MKECFMGVSALFIFLIGMVSNVFAAEKSDAASFKEFVADMSEVVGIRYSVTDDKIRIVVDTSAEVKTKVSWAKDPRRLVVDIPNSWLSPKVDKGMIFESRFAKKLRIAQFDSKTVRLVIETDLADDDCRIFYLPGENGGRVVIDLSGNVEPVKNIETDPKNETENKDKNKDKPVEKIETDIEKNSDDKSKDTKQDKKDRKEQERLEREEKDRLEKERKERERARKLNSRQLNDETADDELSRQIEQLISLKGKKIAIDPGHGGSDAGAIGPSGLMEKTVTLEIGLALRDILESYEAEVVMTRETDTEVHEKGSKATANEELQARVDIANASKSDIFISIHIDSFSNDTAHGTTGYYDSDSKHGYKLADAIRSDLIDQIGTASRGTQPCHFYVVTHSDMTATLIEVAFISNVEEEKMLGSEEGVMLSAYGIADGICDFFG